LPRSNPEARPHAVGLNAELVVASLAFRIGADQIDSKTPGTFSEDDGFNKERFSETPK
jgi:hypothetical protein